MGEIFGNFVRQYPWHVICFLSFIIPAGQFAMNYYCSQKGWNFRFRPLQMGLFIVLFFFSLYAIITGQSF